MNFAMDVLAAMLATLLVIGTAAALLYFWRQR